jgi:hypothetical protein
MKATRVQYTCNPEFVEQNKSNIANVMKEVRAANNPDFKYATYIMEDGKTFMHFALVNKEGADKFLFELASFKKFREELNASAPEVPPKNEQLSLVDSGFDIF